MIIKKTPLRGEVMVEVIDTEMRDRGYFRVKGVVIADDLVINQASKDLLSCKLVNEKLALSFNGDRGEGWLVYRYIGNSEI